MTLEEMNNLDQQRFVEHVGWIFENSPWVAERVWVRRPFRSFQNLHDWMIAEVESAPRDQRLALLRAHPDLGSRARISSVSTSEQAGAGLDRLTEDEHSRLLQWNESYKTKFGFPFLYAVKGSDKFEIMQALEQRLNSEPEQEFQEALRQVYRIAHFRLDEIEMGDVKKGPAW